MHHIFVKKEFVDIDEKSIIIDYKFDFENYNHMANSLRVKVGEDVLCSVYPFIDNYDYKTKITSIDKSEILLGIDERVESSELPITINLYQGMCKSDKFEYIIEKAVELGVHSITPLIVENCVVKYDKNDKKYINKLDRYNKISKSAAEQSKRHMIPEVFMPLGIKEIATSAKDAYNIVFYEGAYGIDKTRDIIKEIKSKNKTGDLKVNIFIGPEGGFTEKEIIYMKDNGFYVLSLGKRILRTETAAITALSIFMYEFEK